MGEQLREHPWRSTSHEVRIGDIGDRMGAYDPDTEVIWLSQGLSQAERRCTLTHESIHAERGDEACLTEWHELKQERLVDVLAARRLIALDDLLSALMWSRDEHELAERLWVDVETIHCRLGDAMTDEEFTYLQRRLAAREESA